MTLFGSFGALDAIGQIANRQSPVFSECCQLSPAIPQFHDVEQKCFVHECQPHNSNRNTKNAGSVRTNFGACEGDMTVNEC